MQKKNITGKEENNPQAEKYMQVLSKLKSMDSLNESKSASSNNLSTGKAVFGSQNWLDRTPSEPRTHTSSILTEKPTISQLPKKMSFLGSQNINASHMGSIMGSMLLGSSEKLQVPGLLPERLNNFKRVRRASMFPTMTNIPDQEDSHEPLRQSAQQLAGKTTDSHQSLEIQESTHSEEAVDQVVEFKQPAVYFEDPETRFSQSGRRRSLLTGVENMPELLSSKRRTSVVETEVQLMQVHVSDELEDSVPESLPFSDENKTSDKKQGVSESKSLGEMSRKSFGESQKSFSESHTRRRHVILQRAGSQSSADSQSNNEDKSMKALTLLSEKRKAFNKTRVAATANVAVPQMPSEYVDPDILEAEEQIRNWERLKEEMRIEKQAQPHKFKTVQDVVEVARDLRRLGMDVALINRCGISTKTRRVFTQDSVGNQEVAQQDQDQRKAKTQVYYSRSTKNACQATIIHVTVHFC
ncbi:hypothetical protein EDD86DRAFT_219619 [Gorgonomyces haynaldii]|nr:hypothetical protein EDD86DRAFT_219619 [Gorgonomyces haynaldii]